MEEKIGFLINTIQVDNGKEFVNDNDVAGKESVFESTINELGMKLKRIRPYSPWQNGKVEIIHREGDKILYKWKVFTSEKDLNAQVAKHKKRYNETDKT